MESFNNISNGTNEFDLRNELGYAFVATVIAHIIFVVIPVLVAGPVALYILLSNKKTRDPPSIVFICTVILSIIAPLFGFLMDISVITDFPLYGTCGSEIGNYTAGGFWFIFGVFQSQLQVSIAFLSIAQYITIRWGPKKLPTRKTVIIYLVLFAFSFFINLVNFIAPYLESNVQIRGSLCYYLDGMIAYLIIGTTITFVSYVPATAIVIIFVSLTYRYVKKNTIANANVVRSVLKVMITMTTSVIVFRFLPALNFLFIYNTGASNDFSNFAINYSSDLSYPLFFFLMLLVHKGVRQTLYAKVKLIWYDNFKMLFGMPSNQVTPSDQITISDQVTSSDQATLSNQVTPSNQVTSSDQVTLSNQVTPSDQVTPEPLVQDESNQARLPHIIKSSHLVESTDRIRLLNDAGSSVISSDYDV